jgi:hypothetical protein
MPMLVLGLAAVVWIARRRVRPDRVDHARRDFAVGLALAASWFSVWGLYAAYTWTAHPFINTLQAIRFYVPATAAIALLGAWLLINLPLRTSLAPVTAAAVIAALLGLGVWSFRNTHEFSAMIVPSRPGHGTQRTDGPPGPGVRHCPADGSPSC